MNPGAPHGSVSAEFSVYKNKTKFSSQKYLRRNSICCTTLLNFEGIRFTSHSYTFQGPLPLYSSAPPDGLLCQHPSCSSNHNRELICLLLLPSSSSSLLNRLTWPLCAYPPYLLPVSQDSSPLFYLPVLCLAVCYRNLITVAKISKRLIISPQTRSS